MSYIKFVFVSLILLGIGNVAAQENIGIYSDDEQAIPIFGKACEDVRRGEPISSTRVRVTDKASYIATENIAELMEFKENHDDYDFNLLIYDLVDNYVEDMVVKTLTQDSKGICVEVNAYVAKNNIYSALERANIEAQRRKEAYNDDLRSPKEIAEEAFAIKQSAYPQITPPNPDEVLKSNDELVKQAQKKIYFAPTAFYNDTTSNKFTDILKQQFSKRDNWKITVQKSNADYIVIPQVLKAKVDPVNKNTNRLQMVVSVELQTGRGKSLITERQNRFVLFTADEEEQEVAFKLLRKLFQNAGNLIMKRIDRDIEKQIDEVQKTYPEIITPTP